MEINYRLFKLVGSMYAKKSVRKFQSKFKVFFHKKQQNLHQKCLKQKSNSIRGRNRL
jgi:hypothetical protein